MEEIRKLRKLNDWTGNSKSIFTPLGASNHSDRERASLDFYASPSHVVTDLLAKHEIPHMPIWECAAGELNLAEPLWANGYEVITSDIVQRSKPIDHIEDFLTTTELRAPIVLTNPPYRDASKFVLHALELGADYVYMLLKTTFLEGQSRYDELFSIYPPKEVWVFTKRVQVALNNDPKEFEKSSAVSYSWFIWEKGFNGSPSVHWI